ncbi:cysteine desulfurase sulfur acceptor subunit CsdE [Vibrio genomosp. F6]|uniref:Cysteine desulfurase, sulfur acceptor subunit CsdE n=1 Tax=Vibrio genomosp. F6 str. FF-238 TaxID=1191298 RepID=A0A1E5CZT8_9VIBR|nr:cysteine desulfurase sulfur acceptor subunit CsdE [Vibrio genomosp. F6]OEE75993.1 cysteine desulfurase, sulfur acceptor subunit CsdE [Vibrio genomosp. F6 str. FF-238]RBW64192.1 cysteine desulfurase sulfur acceptor subunit CsdE [Vibrionales bacterium C3R12]
MSPFQASPFGTEISAEMIVETMQKFHGWEDRYRQVIQWGKLLPKISEELKSDQVTVSGCESTVWLVSQQVNGHWYFCADSDARIVRGLIALVMAAFDGKTAQQIQAFEVDDYFSKIGLIAHLSPSRGNGLKAIVEQIKQLAS